MKRRQCRQGVVAGSIGLIAVLAGACGADDAASVRRFSAAALEAALNAGSAVAVDVRTAAEFQQSHIKGAVHLPLGAVDARHAELPRDKHVVTYCS